MRKYTRIQYTYAFTCSYTIHIHHACTHTDMNVRTYTHICILIFTFVLHVYIYIYIYLFTFIDIYIYMCLHIYIYTHAEHLLWMKFPISRWRESEQPLRSLQNSQSFRLFRRLLFDSRWKRFAFAKFGDVFLIRDSWGLCLI